MVSDASSASYCELPPLLLLLVLLLLLLLLLLITTRRWFGEPVFLFRPCPFLLLWSDKLLLLLACELWSTLSVQHNGNRRFGAGPLARKWERNALVTIKEGTNFGEPVFGPEPHREVTHTRILLQCAPRKSAASGFVGRPLPSLMRGQPAKSSFPVRAAVHGVPFI